MYFEDLTKYAYLTTEDSRNVGWLEKGYFINKGSVPEEFIEKLWKYLRYPVQVCRGFHVCDFCKKPKNGIPIITYKGVKREVGYYEIRVWDENGNMYAAPSLILHYILEHDYKPPQDFIDAVMNSPDASSKEYYQKVLEYTNGDDFWFAKDYTKK